MLKKKKYIIVLLSFIAISFISFLLSHRFFFFPHGVIVKSNDNYKKAYTAFALKKYVLGISFLRKAANDNYNNPILYYRLAEESGAFNNFMKALKYNDKAIDILNDKSRDIEVIHPDELVLFEGKNKDKFTAKVLIQRAHLFYVSGDLTSADKNISKAFKLLPANPNDSRAHDIRGKIALEKADYHQAIKDFKLLVKNSPIYLEAHFYLGKAMIKTGEKSGKEEIKLFIDSAKLNHPLLAEAKKLIQNE